MGPKPPMHKHRSGKIFISYRRQGGAEMARLVRDSLQQRGYSVFMDVEDLKGGLFNTALFDEIESATDVVVVLTPSSLDRCHAEGDWLRLEVAHAIQENKNVIPVMTRGFQWPSEPLPNDLAALPNYSGLAPSHEFFDASMDKLTSLLVGRSRPQRLWMKLGMAIAGMLLVVGTLLLASLGRCQINRKESPPLRPAATAQRGETLPPRITPSDINRKESPPLRPAATAQRNAYLISMATSRSSSYSSPQVRS